MDTVKISVPGRAELNRVPRRMAQELIRYDAVAILPTISRKLIRKEVD